MSRMQRLVVVLALNLVLVAGLVAVGAAAHSLAVLAEEATISLMPLALAWRCWRSACPPARRRGGRPKRRRNATSVAALINAGWLLTLELLVAASATDRLLTHTPQVDGLAVLIISGVAALVMTAGALVLRGDDDGDGEAGERDMSVAAVLLDTIADASAAAGVAAAGGIILATGGWYWLDPAVALAIALVIAWHAAALIRKVIRRLQSRARSAAAADRQGCPGGRSPGLGNIP